MICGSGGWCYIFFPVCAFQLTINLPAGSNPQGANSLAVGITAAIGGVAVGAALASVILAVVFRHKMKKTVLHDDMHASLTKSGEMAL